MGGKEGEGFKRRRAVGGGAVAAVRCGGNGRVGWGGGGGGRGSLTWSEERIGDLAGRVSNFVGGGAKLENCEQPPAGLGCAVFVFRGLRFCSLYWGLV